MSSRAGKVGLVYLFSGLGGSVLSVLFIRNGVSVGASGALFGLLGAMLSELITNWTIYTNRVRISPRLCYYCTCFLSCRTPTDME